MATERHIAIESDDRRALIELEALLDQRQVRVRLALPSPADRREAVADESNKIDLERLRQQNAPLAKVLSMVVDSGTRRDNHSQIAEDLSLGIFARDESTELGAAFKEFEDSVPGELTAESRKDLQRRLQEQLGEADT